GTWRCGTVVADCSNSTRKHARSSYAPKALSASRVLGCRKTSAPNRVTMDYRKEGAKMRDRLRSLLFGAVLIAGLVSGWQAVAQANEQFVPVLVYRTGPYA